MTLDTILLALYIGALIFIPNKRDAIIALLCFMLAYAVAIGQLFYSYQFHLSMSLIYIIGTLSTRNHSLRVLFFVIILYQYSMGFDTFLWPTTETLLYKSYQYVAFLLNLMIIGCIGGCYGASDSWGFIHRRWRFNFPRMALRQSDNTRMRKGEA